MDVRSALELWLLAVMQALGLPGINPGDMQVGMLPKIGMVVDKLPALRITPAVQPDESEPASFEGARFKTYQCDVVFIDALEGDVAANQQTYQQWKQDALDAVQLDADGTLRCTIDGIPPVWDMDVVDAPNFDRSKLAANYAYCGFSVKFHTKEAGQGSNYIIRT